MMVGSLFTGYGGLDLAVGGTLAWYAEVEPAACRVLVAHHPDTPNLGDVTRINWATVPRVDVITAGYPCQPFSHAGKRKGTDDERHLWPYVADAISILEPRLAVLENVAGHLGLGMDIVLGDLADLGYDARWGLVRASDAGAPHGRARVFIVAAPNAARRSRGTGTRRGVPKPEWAAGPTARDQSPTADTDCHGYGRELHARGVAIVEGKAEASPRQRQRARGIPDASRPVCWGKYAPAIHRWESILGRPAPTPTVPGNTGRPRLNPVFVEWMMGLPHGWVTGHGLSNSQALKMLGNGVCPQQARLALNLLEAA